MAVYNIGIEKEKLKSRHPKKLQISTHTTAQKVVEKFSDIT